MNKLNKDQIRDLLPHREPMLLIDELYDIQNLKSATALVNVSKKSFFGDLSVIRTLINRKFKKFTTLFLCSFFPNCPVPPLELPLKKKDAAQ